MALSGFPVKEKPIKKIKDLVKRLSELDDTKVREKIDIFRGYFDMSRDDLLDECKGSDIMVRSNFSDRRLLGLLYDKHFGGGEEE